MEKWVCLMMMLVAILELSFGVKGAEEVTYDGRSLIINGQRNILFSGSIHYPRSTPQVIKSNYNIPIFILLHLSIVSGSYT